MSERPHAASAGDRFGSIDARLNVFALANGMDLTKGPDFRRLEWFTQGLERGIFIWTADDGSYGVEVRSWPTGSEEIRARAALGEGLSAEDLVGLLQRAIERANDL